MKNDIWRRCPHILYVQCLPTHMRKTGTESGIVSTVRRGACITQFRGEHWGGMQIGLDYGQGTFFCLIRLYEKGKG